MNTAFKYARGTVWWLRSNSASADTHVQQGNRPVLIISRNNRGTSSIVDVLTLTTNSDRSSKYPDINVPVVIDDRISYIQCNQHMTVDTKRLVNFYCVIEDTIMKEVERCLLYCSGMDIYYPGDIHQSLIVHPELTSSNVKNDDSETRSEDVETKSDKINAISESNIKQHNTKKWTDEAIKQYVADFTSLSMEDLLEKYNFSNRKSAQNTYYMLRKKI